MMMVMMVLDLLASLALAFPIVEATPVVEGPCPGSYDDPCEDVERWLALRAHNADKIPSDGVLVLQGTHSGLWDEGVVSRVDVKVELDFQPVPGTLELGPMQGLLVWRPDAPWVPGATYKFSATPMAVETPGLNCAGGSGIGGDIIIDSEPGAPLGPPVLAASASVGVNPIISLTSLACCEGAAPQLGMDNCGSTGLVWDPDVCAPILGSGWLFVDFTGEPAAAGPAGQQILYTRKVDGLPDRSLFEPRFGVELSEPFCVELEALDLASGAVTTTGRRCFGEDVADQLGPQAIDPPERLTCGLQICEPTAISWDLERCMPYGPQPDEAVGLGETGGCGCMSGTPGDAGLLALLGLVGFARRRRGRA